MPWNDETGPLPRRSEDDLLALTRSKAEALGERRRREATAGLVTAVVLVAALGALFARGNSKPATEVRAAAGSPAPASTIVAPTTTTAASSTTSVIPSVPPPPPPPTTRPQSAAATTPTVATPDPPGETTTTAGAASTYCDPADYAVRVFTDKTTYQLGEVVRATIEVKNTSGRECYSRGSSNTGTNVLNAAGETVLPGSQTHWDCFGDVPCGTRLAAGAIESSSWCWDQSSIEGQLAPAGTYTIEVMWQGAKGRTSVQTAGTPTSSSTRLSGGVSRC